MTKATLKVKISGPSGAGKTLLMGAIARFLLDEGLDVTCFDEGRAITSDDLSSYRMDPKLASPICISAGEAA